MSRHHPLPAPIADIMRQALRREAFEKTAQENVLYDGEWIGRDTARKVRLRTRLRDLGGMVEALVVAGLLAGVGLIFLLLADALI